LYCGQRGRRKRADLTRPERKVSPAGRGAPVRRVYSAFSDTENVIEDMIGEGDEVLNRWRLEATHSGEFRGIPATGKRIKVTGMGLFRFSDGKVIESWDSFDQLGMLQQLGVIPD
jgi:steroid delta-isomerase-like uncharacterized protein